MINAKIRLCFHIGMTMLNEFKIASGIFMLISWPKMRNKNKWHIVHKINRFTRLVKINPVNRGIWLQPTIDVSP